MNEIYEKLNALVDQTMDAEIADIQKLVRIKSVECAGENGYPYGQGTHDCLELLLSIAGEMGFETKNIDDQCGYVEYGSGDQMVMSLAHLDVVPEGDGWTHDPYGAEIVGDRMFGRGTLDDKGPAVSSLYALKALRDSGAPITKRVRLLFGLNEETGSKGIKYYVDHGGELPVMGFTPDAGYPVINGEKGTRNMTYVYPLTENAPCGIVELKGGTTAGAVPSSAYARIAMPQDADRTLIDRLPEKVTGRWEGQDLVVEAEGVAAHGGRPWLGENAIGRLFLALADLPLEGESAKLCKYFAENFGMDVYGKALEIGCEDTMSGPLSLNLGTIALENGQVTVQIGMRLPVTADADLIHTIFRNKLEAAGFRETKAAGKHSLYVPAECELVKKLTAVYETYTGLPGKPRCIGGGTYAKTMPNLVAFGPNFPGDESRIHKPDEYMGLEKLKRHTKINAAALYELAK